MYCHSRFATQSNCHSDFWGYSIVHTKSKKLEYNLKFGRPKETLKKNLLKRGNGCKPSLDMQNDHHGMAEDRGR